MTLLELLVDTSMVYLVAAQAVVTQHTYSTTTTNNNHTDVSTTPLDPSSTTITTDSTQTK